MEIISGRDFKNYTLLDFGDGIRLEKIENYTISRPDGNAKGHISTNISPDAQFTSNGWVFHKPYPENSAILWEDLAFKVELKNSKQIGLFPEQSANWQLLKSVISKNPGLNVVNLFGYSGAASIVASRAGARVTHVDSSSHALSLLEENESLNAIPKAIRIIKDNVSDFLSKDLRRGIKYDVVLCDPPSFGKAQNKEWSLEKDLLDLLYDIAHILSEDKKLVILNFYSQKINMEKIEVKTKQIFNPVKIESGNLSLESTTHKKLLNGSVLRLFF